MAALGLQLTIRVASSCGATDHGSGATAKERLERWLQGMGHRHCNLKLERAPCGTDALGYGMLAGPGGIETGTVIVQVPRQAFLSEETARKCPFVGPLVQKSQLTSWQVMCMHLLCERARGKESFWYPYISMLPSKLELANFHPLLWSQEVRKEWLAGSPMFDRIEMRLTMCKEDHEAMLATGANDLLPSGTGTVGFVTEAAVQWAAAILLSRAFSLEIDEKDSVDNGASVVLVPWADMLNHSNSAGKESCLVYDEDMKMGTLRAHKPYAEGDQVYDSFGPGLSGPQLFLDYGFVDEDNENNVIDLPATILGPVKSRANGALLEALGLRVDGAVFSITPEGVDESVLAWTRAAVATSQELRAAGWNKSSWTYHNASSAMVYFSEPVSRENESEVLRRLIRACEELTKKYPTTLEQDIAELAVGTDSSMNSPALPWARKQALRAIISEKKALKGAETVLLELLEKLQLGASPSLQCS